MEPFWTVEERPDLQPQRFVFWRKPHFMARKPYPGAVESQFTNACQTSQNRSESGSWKARIELKPQPFHPDARQIRVISVESLQRRDQGTFERYPVLWQKDEQHLADRNTDQPETLDQVSGFAVAQCPVARESLQVEIVGRRIEHGGDS
jgi:hypothetical protein